MKDFSTGARKSQVAGDGIAPRHLGALTVRMVSHP